MMPTQVGIECGHLWCPSHKTSKKRVGVGVGVGVGVAMWTPTGQQELKPTSQLRLERVDY